MSAAKYFFLLFSNDRLFIFGSMIVYIWIFYLSFAVIAIERRIWTPINVKKNYYGSVWRTIKHVAFILNVSSSSLNELLNIFRKNKLVNGIGIFDTCVVFVMQLILIKMLIQFDGTLILITAFGSDGILKKKLCFNLGRLKFCRTK